MSMKYILLRGLISVGVTHYSRKHYLNSFAAAATTFSCLANLEMLL